MIFNYTVNDAARWAKFSGDYNPIHFDLQHAQHFGQKQLTAHGMRVMLDIKNQLSLALLPSELNADFLYFNVRLRQPILCDNVYQLQLSHSKGLVRGKLLDINNGESCFSCKLRNGPILMPVQKANWTVISAESIYQFSQLFFDNITEPTKCWVFFDALLFKVLVASPETLAIAKQVLPNIQADSLIDLFKYIPIIQTHHDVHFSTELLYADPGLYIQNKLQYTIEPTLIVGNAKDGWLLRSSIQARLDSGLLITTTVTLKTWLLANY